ncbi:uncharacterized protein N7511_007564 [Penicillium nucicola]|uniref:uncharacterized protein n=1 Tax=Penicillium nucicola TaxID=1850975 RepID=UPI0025450008|nr:uncharacterized protein N7511_007564 [Penicillium nucicola]KAJ5753411.1 hypothetical protein N7511_007564 [Penicillium nucicola]
MPPKDAKGSRLPFTRVSDSTVHQTDSSRAKKATTACEACQKRKSKVCTPSQASKSVLTPSCVINADNDGRRRITLKRKIESLEQDRNLFERLVEVLRDDDERQVSGILNLIRSNASMDKIRLSMNENRNTSPPHNIQTKSPTSSSRRFMDVRRISDIPLYEVPARPWTSVTNDDFFVSHLVSHYFTWQHGTLNWIDRELFLADMRTGNKSSRFCSPLLVNIMLSCACFYSDYPEIFAIPDDPSTRGEHFLEEAMQHLVLEKDRLCLTTLQAWGDIYTIACIKGKDKLSSQYLIKIADCLSYAMNHRHEMICEANEQSQEMARSIDTAIFGLFSHYSGSILSLQKPTIIQKPTTLEYFPENHDLEDSWTPYPHQGGPVAAHTNCLKNALFVQGLIMWEICNHLFDGETIMRVDPEVINNFHQRLESWAKNLPRCIQLGYASTPGVMEMHMRYHNTIILIFGFITPIMRGDEITTNDRIKRLRTASARHIGCILNQFRSLWPVECMPIAAMQYATTALFTLFEDLEDVENQRFFTDTVITLRALGRRWQFAKGLFRLVQLTTLKENTSLPSDTVAVLRDVLSRSGGAHKVESDAAAWPL